MRNTPAEVPPPPDAQNPAEPVAWRFGPFLLDRGAGRLLRDGQPLDIAPRPWALLCFLVARAGQLVSTDELLDGVWGHEAVSDSTLKVTVNAVRQVLGEDARHAAWVQTVARRGYRFHDAVEALADGAAQGSTSQPAAPAPASSSLASPDAAQSASPALPPLRLGNLPAPVGPLVGRDEALAQLAEALAGHRLVTLTGPGGVGKTRLALAAAARLAPPGGVWLVRLDDLAQADAVGRTVARTLGLGDGAGDTPEALAHALAPMRVTLLLDNAEHLVEALALQVARWLQQAPGLAVIVTSQRPLQLGSERVWPVPPLALPTAAATAVDLAANPAVALMVTLVRSRRPDWQPAAGDWAELAAIARALDGLPLALELAAARVPLLGAAGVRQRLDARLQMLTGGRHDVPARQRTLRASLEWSLALLPPTAARALDRLAVFAGGLTVEAAQAVIGPALPDVDEWAQLEALDLLQDMALLAAVPQPQPGAGGQALPPRLRLLDSVRLLGLERLDAAGDLPAAQAAHRAWVLGLFLAAEEAYFEMGVARWLAPLEAEAENLVAAVDRGLAALESAPPAAPGAAAERVSRPGVGLPDGHGTEVTNEHAAPLATELASLLAACTHFCLRTGLGPVLKRWRERLGAWLVARPVALPPAVQARWCLGGALLGGQGLLPTADALALGEQAVALLGDAAGAGAQQADADSPARSRAAAMPPGAAADRPESARRLQMALYVTGLFQLRLRREEALAATLARMRAAPAAALTSVYVRRLRPMLEAAVAQRRGDEAAYLAFFVDFLAESRALGDRFESWRATLGVGQARCLQGDLDGAVAVMDQAVDEIRAAGQLHTQIGLVSQAVLIRLARDSSPETLARLQEVLPLLQSRGLVFNALGDALAWVPLRQGRQADALRVQAWADARAAVDPAVRSHVAQRLREAFAQQTGDEAPPDGLPLDEADVLRLVLAGAGPAAGHSAPPAA